MSFAEAHVLIRIACVMPKQIRDRPKSLPGSVSNSKLSRDAFTIRVISLVLVGNRHANSEQIVLNAIACVVCIHCALALMIVTIM